jgi:hypothetical protein
VDDVELVAAVGEDARDPHGERLRLGETGRPRGQQLPQIDQIVDLTGPGNPERIGFPVHVEAGHLGQAHPRIEPLGIGLTGEDLDVVAEFDQATAEVTYIDSLPAAVRLTAVGQQRDPHTQMRPRRCGRATTCWSNRFTRGLRTLWTCVQTIV